MNEGYDFVATGHYCGIRSSSSLSSFSTIPELIRGSDPLKDQSYFLSQISGSLLPRLLFPLSSMTKMAVKQIAKEVGLHVFNKRESMGICFIGERNMKGSILLPFSHRLLVSVPLFQQGKDCDGGRQDDR